MNSLPGFRAVHPSVKAACLALVFFTGLNTASGQAPGAPPAWPTVTETHRPWTRWWWMGSAVNEADLTASLEAYRAAGLGGVEITPIYGVAGYEDQFIDYLSDAWMDRLAHTLREAERLGLGVDMATGTGWPFGGPWVGADEATRYVAFKTYAVNSGERLAEPVQYRQEPLLRAVGNQIYELYGILQAEGEKTQGTMDRPPERPGAEPPDLNRLVEPIAENPGLQGLALDQVRFEKDLPLLTLMAYAASGNVLDLTDRVGPDGRLDWVAPAGDWTLYAAFQGWHGKMVERAAPGGEGNVIDHFSETAITRYLERFDRAFAGHDLGTLRAFFNDSYEVDDARGQADWTPGFFDAFAERRGYDLRRHLPALFGRDTDERNARVLSDYRETISDLLLDRFTTRWREWAHGKGALVRNQAHGSPANILDLYAASDIPETEGTEILRAKLASSAANVTGRKLTAAESATWLNEHFSSSLADVKATLDRFMLGGVNHLFYHGTAYSPQGEPWPGWLFYAAVHFTPVNPFWTDFAALNTYVARAQSFLQESRPDNDVLLYFPVYDRFADRGPEMLAHFDGVGAPFDGTALKAGAETLLARGYGFDFVSDRQLRGVRARNGRIETGGVAYRTVVLPESRYVPLETFAHLVELARSGATVIAYRGLPEGVPGLNDLAARQTAFRQLRDGLSFADTETAGIRAAKMGEGLFLTGDDLDALLTHAGVRREAMVDAGLQFTRRSRADGRVYFVVNGGAEEVDGWVPLGVPAEAVAFFDPASEASGYVPLRRAETGGADIYLQLAPGHSALLQTFDAAQAGAPYPFYRAAGAPQLIRGAWTVRFTDGGPELPAEVQTSALDSWTTFGEAAERFAGTAAYTIAFPAPEGEADAWLVDLGRVQESAVVRLNGRDLGTLIGPTYRLLINREELQAQNTLEVRVSNLMTNRIIDLDRRRVPWKKFYNVNFPSRLAENRNERGLFEASAWPWRESGLRGPVTLTGVEWLEN